MLLGGTDVGTGQYERGPVLSPFSIFYHFIPQKYCLPGTWRQQLPPQYWYLMANYSITSSETAIIIKPSVNFPISKFTFSDI